MINLLPGPIIFILYSKVVKNVFNLTLNLSLQKDNVAIIVATFAFTMLGFMAAIITVLFAFVDTVVIKKYQKKNNFVVFFTTYFLTVFSLIVTFLLSILIFSTTSGEVFLRFALASLLNNIVQISIITLTIVNLSHRAFKEKSRS